MTVIKINKTYSIRIQIALLVGVLEALLLGRVVAQLLAARPDNEGIIWLYWLSGPLHWPLQQLDANQPHVGARLEFSALVMAGIVLVSGYLLWYLTERWKERE